MDYLDYLAFVIYQISCAKKGVLAWQWSVLSDDVKNEHRTLAQTQFDEWKEAETKMAKERQNFVDNILS